MEKVEDEFGVEEMVRVLKPAPHQHYSKHDVFVPPLLAKWLRPHQREGVKFMYECVMGLKDFKGYGCILAGATSFCVCVYVCVCVSRDSAVKYRRHHFAASYYCVYE